jgi:hypothetical protein
LKKAFGDWCVAKGANISKQYNMKNIWEAKLDQSQKIKLAFLLDFVANCSDEINPWSAIKVTKTQ